MEKVATGKRRSLDAIFKPKTIAIIGATPRKGTIGYQLLHNIVRYGFNGIVFPVNPKHDYIMSIKCHASVLEIPDDVDLAVVVVPKEYVVSVVDDCGRKGVKGLIIISAGFSEVGGEGIRREAELLELRDRYGFRIVGPNCMGAINAKPEVLMNAAFAPLEPYSGSLAFMTQSGALGVAILLAVNKLNLGLSHFVSVGNKVDVGGNDLLEYWADDDTVRVIALYLESFGEPRRFTELSKRITRQKPVILVKSGTTAAGSQAASSHTGQLAGMEIAVDALLHQCGVLRVSTIEEMMDLILAFSKNPLPRGNRLAVLTNAGGPGIMATDALINAQMSLASLSPQTKDELREMLAAEASVRNPVDMIASATPEQYGTALDAMLKDDNVDAAIVIFVPPIMVAPRRVVEEVTRATKKHDKPVFSVLMAEEKFYEALPVEIPDSPPLYRFPESAVRAMAAMDRHRAWRQRDGGQVQDFDVRREEASVIIDAYVKRGGGYLPPAEVNRVLDAYGFPVVSLELVQFDGSPESSRDAVVAAAGRVGYPIALKVHGRELVHKSDVGGVVIDIADADELVTAHETIITTMKKAGALEQLTGFFVQQMATPGKEIILGMTTDPKFGPLLMFGMGGKYVEVMRDITFRVLPVTDVDAQEMVRSIKSYPLLEGVRGESRVDIEFVVESIQRLAQLVHDQPGIAELDMNPVIVNTVRDECRVVDARLRVATPDTSAVAAATR